MITITEKDEATIITIERPTMEERKVIEQAKTAKANFGKNKSVWSKFKCNQKSVQEYENATNELMTFDGFEPLLSADEGEHK